MSLEGQLQRGSASPQQADQSASSIDRLSCAASGRREGLTSSVNICLTRTNENACAEVSASAPALLAGSADTGYLSSQTSSMRQPLVILLTMIVNPFT